jgi:triosephosphate isomerase
MHTTLSEALILATSLRNSISEVGGVRVVLCPPFPWIVPVAEILTHRPSHLKLGAQDAYYKEEGAVTGAVSAAMLRGIVDYVIVGHSERRRIFKESSTLVNEKVHAVIKQGMTAILAVGELTRVHHQEKRHHGRPTRTEARSDITTQLEEGLEGISKKEVGQIAIAYEPVWAVGTGQAADGVYANHIAELIRKWLTRRFGASLAGEIPILYGGSVTSENVEEFSGQPELDGVLAGGSSLKAKEFTALCHAFAR